MRFADCEHTFAGIRLFSERGLPRKIVEEVLALFTIETLGVVRTLATTVDHVDFVQHTVQWETTGRVTGARARSTHDHIRNGIIVFFLFIRNQKHC